MDKVSEKELIKHTHNAWLSPEGRLYDCAYTEHWDLAFKIVKAEINPKHKEPRGDSLAPDSEQILERLGWIKLSIDTWYSYRPGQVTQAQMDKIFDWCQAHKKKYPPPIIS